MTAHTPGPWTWERVADAGAVTEWSLKGPDVLCRYWRDAKPRDASLIAAAPELLEALRLADHALDVAGYQDVQPIRATVLAAIAKATGTQP